MSTANLPVCQGLYREIFHHRALYLCADAAHTVNQPIRFQVGMPFLTHSILLVLKHTICFWICSKEGRGESKVVRKYRTNHKITHKDNHELHAFYYVHQGKSHAFTKCLSLAQCFLYFAYWIFTITHKLVITISLTLWIKATKRHITS